MFRERPEQIGQQHLRRHMHQLGWHTEKFSGGPYQNSIPDLLCMHKLYGQRWVEMKDRIAGKLSPGQIRKILKWHQYGVQVWILHDEKDYQKLFLKSNSYLFIRQG